MKNFIKLNLIALIRVAVAILLTVCGFFSKDFAKYLSFGLYVLSYLVLCYDILIKATKEIIIDKTLSGKMLIFLASLGAMVIGEYIESNLILIIFVLGEIFEKTVARQAEKPIEILTGLQTNRVRLRNGNVIPAKDVKENDVIEIYTEEIIPVDGMVVGGVSKIDTSIINCERKITEVKHGSKVLSGSVNKGAPISIKVTRPLQSSVAQRLVSVMENSFEKKTRIGTFVQKFTRIYTFVAMVISVLIAALPPIIDMINPIFGNHGFVFWIYKALGFLIVSCLCSMIFSVPLAYYNGIKYASKKGVIIKGAASVELLSDTEIVAFDKTATLTRRELVVTSIDTYGDNIDKLKLLTVVALVERESKHPIAHAILSLAEKLNVHIPEGSNFVETLGSGIECDSMYGHIKAGSKTFVGAPFGIIASVYVSLDGEYVGSIGIGDQLKYNSIRVFENLRKLGIKKKIILSSDKKFKTDKIAKTLVAETAYSNLKPVDKVHAIEDIKTNNPKMKIAYCGAGISDIPSLKSADVGISMGAVGEDSTFEASDVIIIDDDLEKVEKSFRIAKKMQKASLFNVIFPLIIKLSIISMMFIPYFQIKLVYISLANFIVLTLSVLISWFAGRYVENTAKQKHEHPKKKKGKGKSKKIKTKSVYKASKDITE